MIYDRMMRKRYIVWGAVAVAIGIVLILLMKHRDNAASDEYLVQAKTPEFTIRERGFLASGQSVPVSVQASGEIMELVKNGAMVKTGDQILKTDTTGLSEKIDSIELTIHTIKTELQVHKAEYGFAGFKARNDLTLLKARLKLAELEYSEAKKGLTDEERRLLAIDEKIAALDQEDAAEELVRQKRLFDKGFVSHAMLEPFEQRAESAKERIRELAIRSVLRAKGVLPEKLLELKKEVERLDALVMRDAARTKRNLESIKESIKIDNIKIIDHENRMSNVRREMALSVTTAPTNGVVALRIFKDWRSGGQWSEYKQGKKMWRKDYVADIVNPGVMSVRMMIHESDINLVRTGMVCRVRLPAYPGSEFKGVVTEVGGVGRDRLDVAPRGFDHGQTGVIMFNATVSLDNTLHEEFRPGMSALVDIIVK
ncbi:MAG: hypothetical protein KAH23_01420 [Kiritimatiellae bacterium]|nr:hypothetical protein [Kiritimatiellia bacterium]